MAADSITPEAINFMTKNGRGLICLSLTEQRCDALDLRQISPRNTSAFGTPFCEPIDAKRGTTTGISAADRATTILATTDPNTRPEDLARPGTFTLCARGMAACWCGLDRPRLAWIWRGLRGAIIQA